MFFIILVNTLYSLIVSSNMATSLVHRDLSMHGLHKLAPSIGKKMVLSSHAVIEPIWVQVHVVP